MGHIPAVRLRWDPVQLPDDARSALADLASALAAAQAATARLAHALDSPPPLPRPPSVPEAIRLVLAEARRPMRAGQIAEALTERGWAPGWATSGSATRAVRVILVRAVQAGWLKRAGEGLYAL